jgi:PIN domain nuclease of toxin-antitoxin system
MSRLLVDTHVLLWWLTGDRRLSEVAQDAIAHPANEPHVSVASLWEIAIKRSLGKLTAPDDLPDRIADEGFSWLPLRADHAWEVRHLPMQHRDPFDCLLIAQALIERVPVVTADPRFRPYGIDVRW